MKVNLNSICFKCILLGVSIAVLMSFVLTLLSAICIVNEYLAFETALMLQPVNQAISVFLGCFVCGRNTRNNKFMTCILTGLGFYIVSIAIACLFFDGISGDFWTGIVAAVLGSAGAALLSVKGKTLHRRRKRRKLHS